MTTKLTTMMAALLVTAASACGKHDCELGSDEATFGAVAEITKGAHRCSVMNSELVATHGDTSVDAVAQQYKAAADAKGWKVETEDYKGERANGKALEGKLLKIALGDKTATTLVYSLSGSLIETVTTVK
jgi:hypothetical protein